MFRGKKYKDSAKQIDRSVQYEVSDALALVVKTAPAKFDETVEIHIKLGVDSRHADQQVRGAIVLPHGTGKTQCPIGKVSFGAEKLTENLNTLLGAVVKAKPAAAKGQYIRSCVVASTMGPGVKVNTAKF